MIDVIYRYMTAPFAAISTPVSPVKPAILVVALSAIAAAAQPTGSILSAMSPVFLVVLYFTIAMGVWVVQTAFIEFFAQLMGYTAPRLALFSWLGMTHLPMIATLPLAVIGLQFEGISWLTGTLIGGCQLASFILQIATLRRLYSMTWTRAFILYSIPFVAVVLAGLFLVITLGISLW